MSAVVEAAVVEAVTVSRTLRDLLHRMTSLMVEEGPLLEDEDEDDRRAVRVLRARCTLLLDFLGVTAADVPDPIVLRPFDGLVEVLRVDLEAHKNFYEERLEALVYLMQSTPEYLDYNSIQAPEDRPSIAIQIAQVQEHAATILAEVRKMKDLLARLGHPEPDDSDEERMSADLQRERADAVLRRQEIHLTKAGMIHRIDGRLVDPKTGSVVA